MSCSAVIGGMHHLHRSEAGSVVDKGQVSLPQIHLRSEISGSKLCCVLQMGKSGALVCKACRVCPSPSSAAFFVTNCGVDAETYSLLGD